MTKKALITASVASMIDLFNMDNIRILQNLGYQVDVAANFEFGSSTSPERVAQFRQELEDMGVRTYHIPIPRSIYAAKNIMKSYHMLKELCEKEKYSLVHTQTPVGGVVTRFAARKSRKTGTIVIYEAHGFHFFKGAPFSYWAMFYTIEKFTSKFTDILITINQEDYQNAQKFHAGKVFYVPGIGVDVDKYQTPQSNRKQLRAEFGINPEDYLILSVGQLSKRKNQIVMIEAMSQIPDKNVKYMAVGIGDLEDEYNAKIKELGLEGRILLPGYRGDICELLHMADCFVFPSLQEGLPAALMEAMAAGVPVVCSKIRGNCDLVQNQKEGIIIDKNDPTLYAKSILTLRNDQTLASRYVKNAQKKILQFSITNVSGQMEEIYRNIKLPF